MFEYYGVVCNIKYMEQELINLLKELTEKKNELKDYTKSAKEQIKAIEVEINSIIDQCTGEWCNIIFFRKFGYVYGLCAAYA